MLLPAILGVMNVLPAIKDSQKNLEKIKSTSAAHVKPIKVKKDILANLKAPKQRTTVCIKIKTKRKSSKMSLNVWVHFGSKITFLVGLLCIGCYAANMRTAENPDIRDFSLLKNVLDASTLSVCDTEKEQPAEVSRTKREVGTMGHVDDELKNPSCLDEADPIYYVSTYHRAVCMSAVNLAYDVFYEREPSESEFESWFDRCVSREVDEAYMMWKFAEGEEHLKLLEVKREQKMERERNQTSEDAITVPMKLRMPNQEFTEDLNDPESEEFQQLSDDYSEALVDILADDVPGLKGVKILGFGNGSLVVYYELIFDDEVKTVSKLYDDEANEEQSESEGEIKPFDPEKFAEKVKNKVKDVIIEALTNPDERKGKLNNTILSDAHVDLESFETIPPDVVEEFVKLNPSAPIVTVDLTTHHHETNTQLDDKEEVVVEPTEPEHDDDLIISHEEKPQIPTENEEADIQKNSVVETEEITELAETKIIDDALGSDEASGSNAEHVTVSAELDVTTAAYDTDINETEEAYEMPKVEEGSDTDNVEVLEDTDLVPPSSPDDETAEYLDGLNDGMDSSDFDYDYDIVENNDVTTTETAVVENDIIATTAAPTTAETQATTVEEHRANAPTDSGDVTTTEGDVTTTEGDVANHSNVTQVDDDAVAQVTSPPDFSTMPTTLENGHNSTDGKHMPGESTSSNKSLEHELSQIVVMKLRVTNMNYTQNLTDRQSEEFQRLEAKFTQMLRPLLQGMDGFLNMEVVGFSYGSLIVNNELHFEDHAPVNVKQDLKDRIHAAAGYFKYAHVDVDSDATEILRAEEADLCEFVQCHLYSDCVVKTDFRTECVCRPGYVSINPANCVSLCDLEPGYCRNGGECHVVPGRGAVCRCKVNFNWGYQGERCEESMPRSVVLVSASTGVACVTFMLLVALTAYFFHRRKRNAAAKQNKLADKDFMRAAQIMSLEVPPNSDRIQRVNPMFVTEYGMPNASSGRKPKDISTSSSSSPKTSTSSLNKSNGSTSTSSFFVRKQLEHNGPLREYMNTPERTLLRLQTQRYPNHRTTWCEENHSNGRKRDHKKKRERRCRHEQSTAEHQ